MTQRKPEVDRDASLNSDFGAFNEMALRVKQAKEIFLIIGPPGTGKTSFGMLNTLQEEMTNVDASVAVMSFTNDDRRNLFQTSRSRHRLRAN